MKIKFDNFKRGTVMILAIMFCALGYGLIERTLAPWWIPAGVALVVATLMLPLYKKWKWLTLSDGKVINLICHYFHVCVFSFTLFLAGNMFLPSLATREEVTVNVLKKSIEKSSRSHRTGKHGSSSGGRSKTYYLEVAFSDGAVEKLRVSRATYEKATPGKPKVLGLQKGAFGLLFIAKGL